MATRNSFFTFNSTQSTFSVSVSRQPQHNKLLTWKGTRFEWKGRVERKSIFIIPLTIASNKNAQHFVPTRQEFFSIHHDEQLNVDLILPSFSYSTFLNTSTHEAFFKSMKWIISAAKAHGTLFNDSFHIHLVPPAVEWKWADVDINYLSLLVFSFRSHTRSFCHLYFTSPSVNMLRGCFIKRVTNSTGVKLWPIEKSDIDITHSMNPCERLKTST